MAVLYAVSYFRYQNKMLSSLIVKQRMPVTFQTGSPVYDKRHRRGT